MRLTDLSVRSLKAPRRGQTTYYDDGLRGFGVRVSQGGAKSFVVMLGANRRRKTIGRYPNYSLADARKVAKRLLASATVEDLIQRPSVNFADARERFLANSATRNKPSTCAAY